VTARTVGTHRRGPAVAAWLAERRRILGRLAEVEAERDQLVRDNTELRQVIAAYDPMADPAYWQEVYREATEARGDARYADGIERGRRLEAAQRDREWNEAARPIAKGGPSHSELELRRWGPGGREHYGDPQPGDYQGTGSVPPPWPAPPAESAVA
jgi:hypothetical protein